MHSEVGFLRVNPETSKMAFMIAQNTGTVSICVNKLNDNYCEFTPPDYPGVSLLKNKSPGMGSQIYVVKSPRYKGKCSEYAFLQRLFWQI